MLDSLLDWIGKGQASGYSLEEMAMHVRFTDYFAAGIAIGLALLWVQYIEIRKQDLK